MPRSWSNVKYVETRSAAQRAKNRPSSLTAFLILLALLIVLFGGLVAYTTTIALRHPITEIPNAAHPTKSD